MINSLNNKTYNRGNADYARKNANQPRFKGGVSNFLGKVEANPILSLAMIDFLGMIIPRTIIDTKRNEKELGHPNWDAGRETILRESTTSFMLFFMPGLLATGIGNLFLKSRFKKYGINTRSFIDFNTLDASKDRMRKIVTSELKKGNSELSIRELREKYIESMLESSNSKVKEKPPDKDIIDNLKSYITNDENMRKADIKADSESIKRDITSLEEHHKANLIGKDINDNKLTSKIKKLFGESKITVKNGQGKYSCSVNNFVTNTVAFADDLILRPGMKLVKNSKNPYDQKINIKDFCDNMSKSVERLNSFKKVKLYSAFFSTLALLVAFPKINMWISRKCTGSDEFPGLKGLGDSSEPKCEKSGSFLFKEPGCENADK